ncbi:hypothetical protein CFIMG_007971RA00001 [Ceratocystis fimbriata CBS 114723]|uniref:Uncharacterized protein n=1 Tax=Ceratocystis fimbriata CBS 114723 TaxID=1035309 RepID=A0A2C5VYQ9_9PEZI|nr:hypothetical protein CFIMG_007971RA00001 [Ceratocystis fimbriata CBS 114723]
MQRPIIGTRIKAPAKLIRVSRGNNTEPGPYFSPASRHPQPFYPRPKFSEARIVGAQENLRNNGNPVYQEYEDPMCLHIGAVGGP